MDREVGLRLAIESIVTGLFRAEVLTQRQLGTVLATMDEIAFSARQNVPADAEYVELIADNIRIMVQQGPIAPAPS